ncbi:MAG: Lrp/AsnC family transcriptional regulator [Candidatus Nanohaloarchaea archaeon]|nr:Lrp/AsnC family transcriptional regulator [Candidatus Nanohaloarchaea archaeon]
MVSEFDQKLLKELSEDSRQRLKDLARELGVSITTVNNHIQDLEEEGIIDRFTIKANYEELGYTVKALIAVRFRRGSLVESQKQITRSDNVMAVYDVTGSFDAMVVCRFKSTRDMDDFIKEVLPQEEVKRTETFVVLNTFKEDFNTV